MENTSSSSSSDIAEVFRLLQFYYFKETEICLRHEYYSNSLLRNETTVNDYFVVYSYLTKFIFQSAYQLELIQFLFPIFVHLFLDLIQSNSIFECQQFYRTFLYHSTFHSLHSEFFYQLKLISYSSKHFSQCPLTDAFRTSRFFLRLSMTSCTELQNFLDQTKNAIQSNLPTDLTSSQMSLLLSIIHQYLKIDINQQLFTPSNTVHYQTIEQPMTPIFVHTTLASQIQFTRLYTGIFPLQSLPIDRNLPSTYQQIHYNNDFNHIPRLGLHQLPSICLFSLKTKQIINCLVLSDDCQLLAIGFQSSEILVCSMNPTNKLHSMKSVKELRQLQTNFHQENLLNTSVSNERLLIGHQGPILTLAFQITKQNYLLSGSHDCTVRLWHLVTWSCLVVYKMHFQPVLNGKTP